MSRLSRSGGIPNVVRTILRLSNPSVIHHYLCQVRPLDEGLDSDSMPSLQGVCSLGLQGRWTRSPRAIPAAVRLSRLIRTVDPDVIHLHTGSSLIAAPSRFLLRSNSSWLLDLHEPMQVRHSWVTSRLVSAMARYGGWCVAHSPQVTEDIVTTMDVSKDRVFTIPLGIDTENFKSPGMNRVQWRAEYGLSEEQTLIVTVGQVSELKGIWRLLDVADQLRSQGRAGHAVFCVIGGIVGSDLIRKHIQSKGLESDVRLLGFVEDLPSALQAADIYLAASTYEGFGLAVVEAMAAGLPIVASAVGGLNYVVDHGNTGYLVEPQDIDGFVRYLDLLSANPLLRQELGTSAQMRASAEFDERGMVAAYEQLYVRIAT